MSTLLEDTEVVREGDRDARFVLTLRILAGISACMAIATLWSVERAQLPHDLQLAAESHARPGETIAVRALLFRDIEAPEGPTLATASASVRLLDAQERELARAPLIASALTTLDGRLTLPSALSGRFVLEARAQYEARELVCRRPLELDPAAASTRPRGREAGPLQQLAIGRLHTFDAGPAPDPLLVRVVGGSCVPEQPCRLLVWVGEPGASLSLRPGTTVTLPTGPGVAAPPPHETRGIVAIDVVTHGPDAQLTLEARRAGQRVADRSVRLPVALGEVGLRAPQSVVERGPLALGYLPPPGREHVIVDVFAAGRWSASQVVPDAAGATRTLDERLLPSGLVRLQARADRFSAEGSGARVLYVRGPGEDLQAALRAIAREVAAVPDLAAEPTAAWARALPAFAEDDVQTTAAFLLAPLEALRMPVPAAVSARPAALGRLTRTKVALRMGVAGALVLSAFVIALSIAKRGLWATRQAEAILEQARGDSQVRRGELFRERARVLLLVLAVASAFLAGALLIAAKPLWF